MRTVLVLGAGLVSRPLVRYFLERPEFRIVVADVSEARARRLTDGHERATAREVDASDAHSLVAALEEADLAVSLLPPPMHAQVAECAVRTRTDLVTTSYVSPAMQALDVEARRSGVLLMNEVGLDPGIDHISALRAIRTVRRRGGRVVGFRSVCGGLPAPENRHTNPWSYKFSWSPRGVLVAARHPARWLEDQKIVEVDSDRLFSATKAFPMEELGPLEIYPNRDSVAYIPKYELDGVRDMMRGTVRWHRWGETLGAAVRLGLLDPEPHSWPAGTTWASMVGSLLPEGSGELRHRVAAALMLSPDHEVLDRFAWAGFFSDEPLPDGIRSPLDAMTARLAEKLVYAPEERDMVILEHALTFEEPDGSTSREIHRLVAFGEPGGDSAMSRTVALPAAVLGRMRLEGSLDSLTGVQIPVAPEIVDPVLAELEETGIRFRVFDDQPPPGAAG
jgi:saccharopine dehydrogenase-like NADP-dependent oxidoreductase